MERVDEDYSSLPKDRAGKSLNDAKYEVLRSSQDMPSSGWDRLNVARSAMPARQAGLLEGQPCQEAACCPSTIRGL